MGNLKEIISILTKEFENTQSDYYNENTYNYSQGYRKGLLRAIEILKQLNV